MFKVIMVVQMLFRTLENNNIKKTLLLFCLVLSLGGCSGTRDVKGSTKKEKHTSQTTEFIPDTGVNDIYLRNPISVQHLLGNLMPGLNDEDLPSVYISNINKSQYLKLIFFPADIENNFSVFLIGYNSDIETSDNLKVKEFSTKGGIKLGITKDKVVALKGMKFKSITEGKFIKYRYELNSENDLILKSYNMALYFSEYVFNDKNLLVQFSFGFEYP